MPHSILGRKEYYFLLGNYKLINYHIINQYLHMYSMFNIIYVLSKTLKDYQMTDFQRDILIGLMFIIGIIGFISGEFIISTVLFATAAILSNIFLNRGLSG
jgi:CheY-specific phosphatase CheX